MKKQILSEEFCRMQKLAGIITEQVEQLQIIDKKSEDGNIQKMIRVKGRGLTGGELILSTEEFDALKELAKEFAGNRNNEISKGVNTKDKMSTQSIIGIKPKGLNLELYRKESFGGPQRYKGYDESDTGGELVAQQSVIYQLADDKLAESNILDQDFKVLKNQQDILKKVTKFYIEKATKLGVDRKLIGDFNAAINALEDAIFKGDYNK
jgi:hypothetical protein